MGETYWLSANVDGVPEQWTEVTEHQFRSAERKAGFVGKTGGFSGGGIKGTTLFEPDVDNLDTIESRYGWRPALVKAFKAARTDGYDKAIAHTCDDGPQCLDPTHMEIVDIQERAKS
jgi:hypothetical protein